MHNSFENNIRAIFKKHGLENEKLESVVVDLFNDFETHLLHSDFVKEVTKIQERENKTRQRFS